MVCPERMDQIQLDRNLLRRFPETARYLVGVSGGRDSVALLHRLLDFGYKNLVVGHLTHQLRGRSSAADARFVKKLVATYRKKIVGQALRLPHSQIGKRRACPTTLDRNIDFALGSANIRALAKKK